MENPKHFKIEFMKKMAVAKYYIFLGSTATIFSFNRRWILVKASVFLQTIFGNWKRNENINYIPLISSKTLMGNVTQLPKQVISSMVLLSVWNAKVSLSLFLVKWLFDNVYYTCSSVLYYWDLRHSHVAIFVK